MKLDIKLFYLSFHNQLKTKYGVNKVIKRRTIYCDLGKHFLIPKNLKEVALKELEEMKLIKRKNRDDIIILEYKLDIERDAKKFYEKLGLY